MRDYRYDTIEGLLSKYPNENIYYLRASAAIGGGGLFEPFDDIINLGNYVEICSSDIDKNKHIDENSHIVAIQAPDEFIKIQGNYNGLNAEVTLDKRPMGDQTRDPNYQFNPWKNISRLQLRDIIGISNINKLDELVEAFSPDSMLIKNNPIIEFSVYTKPIGVLKENMIIWEIRHY
jgi:hypothetical protein